MIAPDKPAAVIKDMMLSCRPDKQTQSMDESKLTTKETAKTMDESRLFTTHRKKPTKRLYRKHEAIDDNSDSITNSNLSSNDYLVDLLGLKDLVTELDDKTTGKHPHLSFDCPTKLRDAFKEATRAQKSNVCDELQKFQVSYVIAYRLKKNTFGNTLSKLLPTEISIGSVNLNQYTQARVRRKPDVAVKSEPEVEPEPKPETPAIQHCGFNGCMEPAIAKATNRSYKGNGEYAFKEFLVCQKHLDDRVKVDPDPKAWSNVVMLGEAPA